MRIIALVILVGLSSAAVTALADIKFDKFDGEPLFADSGDRATGYLKLALGDELYKLLDQSSHRYVIEFDEQRLIGLYTRFGPDQLKEVNGLTERDSNADDTFIIHVNQDWVSRQVADWKTNHPKLATADGLNNASRIFALAVIIHEATHCSQLERHQLEISTHRDDQNPRLHAKEALDKYDEYYAWVAQLRWMNAMFKLSLQVEDLAIQTVNQYYSGPDPNPSLDAKNYVWRNNGQATDPSPFPWPGQSDQKRSMAASDQKSFNAYLVQSASGDGSQATNGTSSTAVSIGPSGDAGDGDSSAALLQPTDGPAKLDPGVCGDGASVVSAMAGGSDGQSGDTADAKRSVRPKPGR